MRKQRAFEAGSQRLRSIVWLATEKLSWRKSTVEVHRELSRQATQLKQMKKSLLEFF